MTADKERKINPSQLLANLRKTDNADELKQQAPQRVTVSVPIELVNSLVQLEERQGDLSADLATYRRLHSRSLSDIKGTVSELHTDLERGIREFKILRQEFNLTRDCADNNNQHLSIVLPKLDVVEESLTRCKQGLSLVGTEVSAMRKVRLTITHIALFTVGAAFLINAFVSWHVAGAKVNTDERLDRLEQALGRYLY